MHFLPSGCCCVHPREACCVGTPVPVISQAPHHGVPALGSHRVEGTRALSLLCTQKSRMHALIYAQSGLPPSLLGDACLVT